MHLDIIRTAPAPLAIQAFVLSLADGRSLEVAHPEVVAISPRQVIVVDPQDESVTWIEPLLIVSLDFPQPQTGTASGNGLEDNNGPG